MATHRIETSGVHAAECSVSHPRALLAQFAGRLAMALGFSVSMILVAPCVASAQPFLFRGWVLSEFQPDIANGGRANTIAVALPAMSPGLASRSTSTRGSSSFS